MIYKRAGLSRLSLRELRERRRSIARSFPDVAEIVAGSLQKQHRRCGNPGCRCARGELHGPYVYLAVRAGARTRLVYVAAELATEIGRRVAVSERAQKSLAEISAINLELLSRGALD